MQSTLVLAGSILLALAAGGIGGIATSRSVSTWYATLAKPSWNPPGWVFGPVWTLLYLLMGVSAWMVWRKVGFEAKWVALYLVQLALNIGWSFLFFGTRRPDWAFAEIVVLLLSIALTVVAFWKIDRVAGMMLVPYLAWVAFASFLNFTIWRLNAGSL